MNERVKELRKFLGLSGEKFGEKIGVKRSAISDIETGRNNLTEQMMKTICFAYNVNEDWLRTGEGKMFKEFTRDEEIAKFVGNIQSVEDDTFKKRFISMLSKLNESEWLMLEKMALELTEKKD